MMVGGTIMGYLGGIHDWWPKITGKMYPELPAKLSALVVFIGFNLTFFPQFILGYLGMPRRYHAYPEEFQVLNVLSSAGASILGIGYLIPMVYFAWSMRYGPKAAPNPWKAKGLEWGIASPPITENFESQPIVTEEAYGYGQPAHKPDEGAHGARGRARASPADRAVPAAHDRARRRVPRRQGRRVQGQVRAPPGARPALQRPRAAARGRRRAARAALLLALLRDDRAAR